MSTVNTGSFPHALSPGVHAWWGINYKSLDTEYDKVFEVQGSKKNSEEEVGVTGGGLAPIKTEGRAITYTSFAEGFLKRYTHVTYGNGIIITREEWEDNLYDQLMKRRTFILAKSLRDTKETVCFNHFNRAFTSTYTGADGKELCATDHPFKNSGTTYQNELSTAADLSEASLEQACIDIDAWEDDGGGKIKIMPQKLLIPGALQFETARILKSVLQNDTANNAINALRANGSIPGGYMVGHWLTDADAWFVLTDCPDGLKYFNRRSDEFADDNDFDTENYKAKATTRFSSGWTDPHSVYGSPGA